MFDKQCQRDLLVYEKTKQKYRLSMLRLRVSWRVHTVVVVAQGPGLRHLVDGEQPAEGMANATGWTDASALHVGSGGPRLLFMLLAGLRGIDPEELGAHRFLMQGEDDAAAEMVRAVHEQCSRLLPSFARRFPTPDST